MNIASFESPGGDVDSGHRKVAPRACIIESRQHVRDFLKEAFERAGFVIRVCATPAELAVCVDRQPPRLTVLCVSPDDNERDDILRLLFSARFQGKILLLGPEDLPALAAVWRAANELGLKVLPPLFTPFSDKSLRASVAALLSEDEPSRPPIDVAEAIAAGWLELWYQPKVNAQSLCFDSAEALVRMRHPQWGLVLPAYFIPDDSDPHIHALSEFVIGRAISDWRDFAVGHGHVEIAINLPVDFLRNGVSVDRLCAQLPHDAAFRGMIVEVNGTELLRDLDLMKDVAARVRFHNIGISIDDLGAEWPLLLRNVGHFPFVEIKVDRKFVAGCANDPLKRDICRHILAFASSVGSRSIAEGVEAREDFLCVRDMGFDVVQGFFFEKPAPARTFEESVLAHSIAPPRWQLRGTETFLTPQSGEHPAVFNG